MATNTDTLVLNKPVIAKNSTKKVIEIEHLQKSFGEQEVLKDVSLNLEAGENLVVLGKSGTGKSVLIKCIVRLLFPDSGSIRVFGKDINTLSAPDLELMRRKIGFLFQGGALYDSMSVKQNLEFPLRRINKLMKKAEIDNKIKEALDNVGLFDTLDKMPSELSGGMRKRISLARTIVVDPQIMLYDEPTTGLDPASSSEISLLINEVQKKYKTSSIIITHDISCARMIATRVIMLHEGTVYHEGSIDFFERSRDVLIESFFQQHNSTKNQNYGNALK
jgi:phospholipid/cholesterol/gamma-HCH transport system ATP-binding protein